MSCGKSPETELLPRHRHDAHPGRYRHAQIKAAVKVNSEQLLFNWQLGATLYDEKPKRNGVRALSIR